MRKRQMTYRTRTDDDIKDAFLTILATKPLADITISELVREARVSRSTFYLHYDNLSELYDELVSEVEGIVLPLINECGCEGSPECGKQPFCFMVRGDNRYRPLFKEPRFLETVFQSRDAQEQNKLIMKLMDRGLDAQQARAIFTFQMSGCFAVSTMLGVGDRDWPKVRKTLDVFIRGGLAALDD